MKHTYEKSEIIANVYNGIDKLSLPVDFDTEELVSSILDEFELEVE